MTGAWQYTKLTVIYTRCIKEGHNLIVDKIAFDNLYLYCQTCRYHYRVKGERAQYCPPEDWKEGENSDSS